jgi:peptide/nickel transport system substrate-binding protein
MSIVPKSLIDAGHDFNAQPIGTGPYVFQKWIPGESLIFKKFDDFFGKDRQPQITDMTWQIIPEDASRTIAIETGEVDFLYDVGTTDVRRLKENANVTVFETPGTIYQFLCLNNEDKGDHFDNPLVRKAIDMAVNKDDIVVGACNNMASVTYSQVPLILAGASNKGVNAYDPEKARALLKESGVDVKDIKFSIIVANDTRRRAAEIIQSNLADLGMEVSIEYMDLATYMSTTAEGNFEAAIVSFSTTITLAGLDMMWTKKAINLLNKARLADDYVNDTILKARITADPVEMEAMVTAVSERLNELCPQVPLWLDISLKAYNSNLEVPEVNALGEVAFELARWK